MITITLFVAIYVMKSGHSYTRYGYVPVEDINPYAVGMMLAIFFALVLARLGKRESLPKTQIELEKKQGPEVYDDNYQRQQWTQQVVDFLADSKPGIYSGKDLVSILGHEEPMKNFDSDTRKKWEEFVRNKSGWQNGLRFFIQGFPSIEIRKSKTVSDEESSAAYQEKREIPDGYEYVCK